VTQGAGSLNLTETFTFDPARGQMLTHTDANTRLCSTQYDVFGRLTMVINPNDTASLPTLSYQYFLNPNINASTPHSITFNCASCISSTFTLTTYTFYDGLGRKRETKSPSPGGSQVISDFATYDSRGLISLSYLPYTSSSVSCALFAGGHDKTFRQVSVRRFGRLIQVINPTPQQWPSPTAIGQKPTQTPTDHIKDTQDGLRADHGGPGA